MVSAGEKGRDVGVQMSGGDSGTVAVASAGAVVVFAVFAAVVVVVVAWTSGVGRFKYICVSFHLSPFGKDVLVSSTSMVISAAPEEDRAVSGVRKGERNMKRESW